ncbi:MAG: tetratricopeptide repeat protein [Treponema sp.]|jgi:tetratricopeptide (TPR) repeat protein|nr:tetratricopeptide repeat protein [Treponema sp.]
MNRCGMNSARLAVFTAFFGLCLVSCGGTPTVPLYDRVEPPPPPPLSNPVDESSALSREYLIQVDQYIAQGDYQGALAVLEHARNEYPAGSDRLWWGFGQCYEKTAQADSIQNAIDSYRRLVQRFTQSSYFNRAMRRLVELGDRKPFFPPLRRKRNAVEWEFYMIPSRFPLVFTARQSAAYRESIADGSTEYDEDIEAYNQARTADPDNPGIPAVLAGFYTVRDKEGDADLAVKYSEAALALQPGDPALLFFRAMAYGNGQDYKGAIDAFQDLIKMAGEDPFIYYLIAMNEVKRGGRDREAVQALEKALDLEPDFAEAREELDRLSKKLKP